MSALPPHGAPAISPTEFQRLFKLPPRTQYCLIGVGLVFIVVALLLFAYPPSRVTREVSGKDQSSTKVTTSDADPAPVVVALVTGGVALIAFGVNGVRFSKVEALGVKADLGQTLDANASSAAIQVTAAPATDHVHTFLLRSSWNGLKVLKACQWASKGKRILHLRQLCTVGAQMSFDYAFGYFVASISADALMGTANGETGTIVVSTVHATLDQRIDDVLEGCIRAYPDQAEARRDDLNALLAYLKNQPTFT